jgi:hypothetical protein
VAENGDLAKSCFIADRIVEMDLDESCFVTENGDLDKSCFIADRIVDMGLDESCFIADRKVDMMPAGFEDCDDDVSRLGLG